MVEKRRKIEDSEIERNDCNRDFKREREREMEKGRERKRAENLNKKRRHVFTCAYFRFVILSF